MLPTTSATPTSPVMMPYSAPTPTSPTSDPDGNHVFIVVKSVTPCKDYSSGKCHRGDKCKFAHTGPGPRHAIAACRDWASGTCNRGAACKYFHEGPSGGGLANGQWQNYHHHMAGYHDPVMYQNQACQPISSPPMHPLRSPPQSPIDGMPPGFPKSPIQQPAAAMEHMWPVSPTSAAGQIQMAEMEVIRCRQALSDAEAHLARLRVAAGMGEFNLDHQPCHSMPPPPMSPQHSLPSSQQSLPSSQQLPQTQVKQQQQQQHRGAKTGTDSPPSDDSHPTTPCTSTPNNEPLYPNVQRGISSSSMVKQHQPYGA